jgi:ankyrin repeat protein
MTRSRFLIAIGDHDYEMVRETIGQQPQKTLQRAAFVLLEQAVELQMEWVDDSEVVDYMDLLISNGLEINDKLMNQALELMNAQYAKMFIKAGAVITGKQLFDAIKYDESVKFVINHASQSTLKFKDRKKNSALHIACEHKNANAVKYLIKAGAKLNTRNTKKQTPLHVAYKNEFSPGISMLEKSGAKQDYKDVSGKTAREYAQAMQDAKTFVAGLPVIGHRASLPSKQPSASPRTPSAPKKKKTRTRDTRSKDFRAAGDFFKDLQIWGVL